MRTVSHGFRCCTCGWFGKRTKLQRLDSTQPVGSFRIHWSHEYIDWQVGQQTYLRKLLLELVWIERMLSGSLEIKDCGMATNLLESVLKNIARNVSRVFKAVSDRRNNDWNIKRKNIYNFSSGASGSFATCWVEVGKRSSDSSGHSSSPVSTSGPASTSTYKI